MVRRVLHSRPVRDYALMTFGVALTAYGFSTFLIPNKIAAGGVSGLATIIHYVSLDLIGTKISVALMMLLMNSILLVVAWRARGLQYAAKTTFGVLAISGFIEVFSRWIQPLATDDLLLAALYGGVVTGLGMGLVFKAGGNTGGTDIVGQLLSRRVPFGVGQIMLAADAAVTLVAAIAFGPRLAMYGAVAIFVSSATIDMVLEGISVHKAAFVISQRHDDIAEAVLEDLGRGATTLQATGAYTGEPRKMLYVVLSRNQIDSLKRIVATLDPNAMVVISDVHESIGEGFNEMRTS
jgi:uncharacterized membrane-anchored protein YitT (DUF2179 family)